MVSAATAIRPPLSTQWERWSSLSGVVFVILMVVGTMFVADVPPADASQQTIADYLADGDNHTRNIIGGYLWMLGALAFLLFAIRLRGVLREAEGGTGTLSNLVFGAGAIYSALMMVSSATFAAVAYAVALRDAPVTDPDLVRVLREMAWMILLLGAGFAGLFLIVVSCIATFRTGVLPRWLAWLGILAAILLLFDVIYVSIAPLLAWVLVASIVLVMRQRRHPSLVSRPSTSRHPDVPASSRLGEDVSSSQRADRFGRTIVRSCRREVMPSFYSSSRTRVDRHQA
jgi:Domain of unknown function (DUF4386)